MTGLMPGNEQSDRKVNRAQVSLPLATVISVLKAWFPFQDHLRIPFSGADIVNEDLGFGTQELHLLVAMQDLSGL